jgi:hypothetical protein
MKANFKLVLRSGKKDKANRGLHPVFRTPRKGGILHQEVFEWELGDVVMTSSSSLMRFE